MPTNQVSTLEPTAPAWLIPPLVRLLWPPREAALDAGSPQVSMQKVIASPDPGSIWGECPVQVAEAAQAAWAGLWLYFDLLDESHRVSQTLTCSSGSYWHGMMHRREGDFGNAQYWFRRVGRHPIEVTLAQQAQNYADTLAGSMQRRLTELVEDGRWRPERFVEWVASVVHQPDSAAHAVCRRLQALEWWTLFEYDVRRAVGSVSTPS